MSRAVTLIVLVALVAVTTGGALPAAHSETAPIQVIVEGTSIDQAAAAVRAVDGHVTAELDIIKAVAAEVPQNRLAHLTRAPGVVRVTPDHAVKEAGRRRRVNVEFSKAVGAKKVWDSGNLGQGVTVAVLDSGIAPLAELRRGPKNYRKAHRILAYYDAFSDSLYGPRRLGRSPQDPNGHGTHVAGIIGNSAFERREGEFRGLAPATDLVAVRVLDETGMGMYSDVIKGIDWVVKNQDAYDIRVLNISLYAPVHAPYWADPLNLAAMAAWQAGIVVVTGAGNDGPDPMSIGVPGNTPYIITVGAFTDNYTAQDFGDDYIPPFSASGPTLDAFIKPDLIAPGAHVISLMRRNAYLAKQHPDNFVGSRYFQMAGTSMSTAVVSGIAALMLAENPELTPDEVKYRLTITARPQFSEYSGQAAYSIWEQGAGRVWAPDAVFTDVEGEANVGMDLAADLAGEEHYEGWAYYDPDSGEFTIRDDGYAGWAGDYAGWAGGYAGWAGAYHDYSEGYDEWAGGTTNWSGDFNDWISAYEGWSNGFNPWAGGYAGWAGGYAGWAGGYAGWAGGYAGWAGDYAGWAGGYAGWAGGYAGWAGGYAGWAGGYAGWAGSYGDATWAENFVNLENTPSGASSVGINVSVSDN